MPKRASKNPNLFRVNGLTFLIKFTPIPHDFSGLLLSFRVTVLAVFRVRELPYCVHLKFLCCNYLCKNNKIFWTCKMKVWDESKTDAFRLKSHYQLFSKVNIVFALTFEWESDPKIARQTLMVRRAWTGLRNLSSRVVSAALNQVVEHLVAALDNMRF